METTTRPAEIEFCLVLTPTLSAPTRASEAVLQRLTMLEAETRRDLAAVVAELVQSSLERGPGRPITVTVGVGPEAIHGEVSDHGNPAVAPRIPNGRNGGSELALLDNLTSRWGVHEGSTDVWFEIAFAR